MHSMMLLSLLAMPPDIAFDTGRTPPVVVRGPDESDFRVKRWHEGTIRGRKVRIWGVRDRDDPGMILMDFGEQPPEVKALYPERRPISPPPVVVRPAMTRPMPRPMPQVMMPPMPQYIPTGVGRSVGMCSSVG